MNCDKVRIPLEVVSYTDSLFTNAHEMVSDAEAQDGRGTFTHLGVKMEGLESSRHLNFSTAPLVKIDSLVTIPHCEELFFRRDGSVRNEVVLRVRDNQVASVKELEFDTRFYTRNNVNMVYSVTGYALNATGTSREEIVLAEGVALQGDSVLRVPVAHANVAISEIKLSLSEGGLTRFHVYGKVMGKVPGNDTVDDLVHGLKGSNSVRVVHASDASYGDPTLVLRKSREGSVMAGWESCRHSYRQYLCLEWDKPVHVQRLEVDTYMHCLNAFKYVMVLVSQQSFMGNLDALEMSLPKWSCRDRSDPRTIEKVPDPQLDSFMTAQQQSHNKRDFDYALLREDIESGDVWKVLLSAQKLNRDTLHQFDTGNSLKIIDSAVKSLLIIGLPDGGIHRFGVYGKSII